MPDVPMKGEIERAYASSTVLIIAGLSQEGSHHES